MPPRALQYFFNFNTVNYNIIYNTNNTIFYINAFNYIQKNYNTNNKIYNIYNNNIFNIFNTKNNIFGYGCIARPKDIRSSSPPRLKIGGSY